MARCLIIAGPNGAGKTTFAREFLLKDANISHFINADLIASGLSPLRPALAARAAGRLFLQELDRFAAERAEFAFESTLSGMGYVSRLKRWKKRGISNRNHIFAHTIARISAETCRRASPPGWSRCPQVRCVAPVCAKLEKFWDDLPRACGAVGSV